MISIRIERVIGFEIAGVIFAQILCHVVIYVGGLYFTAQRIGVGKQKAATVGIFRFQMIVIKSVHYQFRQFQNCKSDGYWFVQRDLLSRASDQQKVVVDYFALSKRGF